MPYGKGQSYSSTVTVVGHSGQLSKWPVAPIRPDMNATSDDLIGIGAARFAEQFTDAYFGGM